MYILTMQKKGAKYVKVTSHDLLFLALCLLFNNFSNGIIIHIMGNGYYGSNYYDSSHNDTLCDRGLILDTNTDTWSIQILTGSPPQQIISGFAVLGINDIDISFVC